MLPRIDTNDEAPVDDETLLPPIDAVDVPPVNNGLLVPTVDGSDEPPVVVEILLLLEPSIRCRATSATVGCSRGASSRRMTIAGAG